jgi:hypothetical protein
MEDHPSLLPDAPGDILNDIQGNRLHPQPSGAGQTSKAIIVKQA